VTRPRPGGGGAGGRGGGGRRGGAKRALNFLSAHVTDSISCAFYPLNGLGAVLQAYNLFFSSAKNILFFQSYS
jgi:hypothetical protein